MEAFSFYICSLSIFAFSIHQLNTPNEMRSIRSESLLKGFHRSYNISKHIIIHFPLLNFFTETKL